MPVTPIYHTAHDIRLSLSFMISIFSSIVLVSLVSCFCHCFIFCFSYFYLFIYLPFCYSGCSCAIPLSFFLFSVIAHVSHIVLASCTPLMLTYISSFQLTRVVFDSAQHTCSPFQVPGRRTITAATTWTLSLSPK